MISRPILEVANLNNIKVYRHERGSSLNKYEIFQKDIFNEKYMYDLIRIIGKKIETKKIKNKLYLTILEIYKIINIIKN